MTTSDTTPAVTPTSGGTPSKARAAAAQSPSHKPTKSLVRDLLLYFILGAD